jgi:hypothetical protein
MDEDKADMKWKSVLRHYNLSGHHIRTNEKLRKELIDILWGGKGYIIPRYLIINKAGEIAEKDALRPSTKDKLYEQISKHL